MAKAVNLKNSHYLNQRRRIKNISKRLPWTDRDADYNIRLGLTFGESEEVTIEKQRWNGG